MKIRVMAGILCLLVAAPVVLLGAEQEESNGYISVKMAVLYEEPTSNSKEILSISFGEEIQILDPEGIEQPDVTMDAGTVVWHSASYKEKNGEIVSGYLPETSYSKIRMLQRNSSSTVAIGDGDILDYPGKKDGEIIGELLEYDTVQCTASVGEDWSQIVFMNSESAQQVGYVQSSLLESGQEKTDSENTISVENAAENEHSSEMSSTEENIATGDSMEESSTNQISEAAEQTEENSAEQTPETGDSTKESNAESNQENKDSENSDSKDEDAAIGTTDELTGILHESTGQGIFAEAVEGVEDEAGIDANGVQIGTPVGVSSNATLVSLGVFRITHYCPCSICCGPYTDGITSTGVTATTNHTIAVEPNQIPYGSKVVINGQVYVAEDCGGGIKTNCIDIYVATHAEGEAKGVYYTDVYLLTE